MNFVYFLVVEHMDDQERAEFDERLTGDTRASRARRAEQLAALGGDVRRVRRS